MIPAPFDPKQWDPFLEESPALTRLYRSLCLALLLFALFLRIPGLSRSLWYDELFSVMNFMSGSFVDSLWTYRAANNHPLYSFLAKLSASFFQGDEAFRYPALIFGLLAVWLPLSLGPRLGLSRLTSFIAALLLAVAPGHVLYSVEARAYSASVLACGLLMIWPCLKVKSPRDYWSFAGMIVFALWIHPANALVSVAVTASLLLQTLPKTKRLAPKNSKAKSFLKAALLGHALAFLLYLKILKRVVSFARRNVLQELNFAPEQYFSGLLKALSSWDHVAELSGLLLALACLGLIRAFKEEGPLQRLSWHFLLCLVLSSLFWLLPGTLYYPRFSLTLLLPFLLFAAYGLTLFLKKGRPGMAFIALFLFSIIGLQAPIAWRWVREPLQDYEEAMRLARDWRDETKGTIVAGATGAELFEHYDSKAIPIIERPEQLRELRRRGPVIYLEAFAEESLGPVKEQLKESKRVQSFPGLRYTVKSYEFDALPRRE